MCTQQAFNDSKCEGHGFLLSWLNFLVCSAMLLDGAFCKTNKMLGDDQQEAYLNRERTVRTTSIW